MFGGEIGMKKHMVTAIAAAVCTAASTVSYGAVFSDIGNNLKWAESYINSVYNSGLMVGDYNSRGQRVFRGSENMTYSEAAQLIYSIVLKSGFSSDVSEVGINRYSMEMNNAGIADWAKKAVAFCMEKGVVSSYDLTKFKKNGSDVKISREDMAVFFGKALALNYTVSTGTSLSFNDTSDINANAKPYVELLNKLGIVSGDNNNKFNPKANITRAEVSVLASKTFDLMKKQVITNPESGYTQTSGTVVSIYDTNGSYVVRLVTNGGTEGFVLTSEIPVYNNASNNVGPSGLGLGDSVTVYHSGASIARVVITKDVEVDTNSTNSSQFNNIIKDKGELISAGEYKIGLIDKHGDKVYYVVAENADITLDGKKATLRQLSDRVKNDAQIEVSVEVNSSINEASKVTAVEGKYSSGTEGKITNLTRRAISIKSAADKTYNYKIADSVSIKYNGASINTADIMDTFIDYYDNLSGSKYIDVELTLNNDKEVTKIVATSSDYKEDDDKNISGEIKNISSNTIKVGSKEYNIASNAKVDIVIGSDDIDDIDDLIEAINDGGVTVKADIKIKDGKVSSISGYVTQIEGDLTYMTVRNTSYPRGEMGLRISGYGQINFEYDEDTKIDIGGTVYDDVNIESLKKMINGSGASGVKVKFDKDGLATSVKG